MVFKPVERTTISMNKAELNAFWVGTYLGKKVVKTRDGKDQAIYQFLDEDGKPFAIWGFTALDMQMEAVKEKAMCRMTYKGKSPKKNKFGNYSNLCLVEVDEEHEDEEQPLE